MSRIEELEKQIQELQHELEVEKQKESFNFPVGYHDTYYLLTAFGEIKEDWWLGSIRDKNKSYQGNIFKTEQEAEKERDRRILLTRFRQFRDKCNGDWKPETYDRKYFIVYDGSKKVVESRWNDMWDNFHTFGYFEHERHCLRAIELFGDEIIRLWVDE